MARGFLAKEEEEKRKKKKKNRIKTMGQYAGGEGAEAKGNEEKKLPPLLIFILPRRLEKGTETQ